MATLWSPTGLPAEGRHIVDNVVAVAQGKRYRLQKKKQKNFWLKTCPGECTQVSRSSALRAAWQRAGSLLAACSPARLMTCYRAPPFYRGVISSCAMPLLPYLPLRLHLHPPRTRKIHGFSIPPPAQAY